jgi:uncharacterized membrane protein
MLGYDWPRLHAAVNTLPVALLFVTVLFDFAGWWTRRESLKAAALWTLWAGVIGGWVAVIAGLRAEDVIEHGEATHELMETHETLALITMSVFTVILVAKLVRRARLGGTEDAILRVLSIGGFVMLLWTARIGGKMMFDHAAGITTATMVQEMGERAAGHHHHEAGEPEPHDADASAGSRADSAHRHVAGTPPARQ